MNVMYVPSFKKKFFCHVIKKEMIAKFKELTKLEIAKEGKKDLEN